MNDPDLAGRDGSPSRLERTVVSDAPERRPYREIPRSARAVAAGVTVIAATYVYFLLFAEFALLALAQMGPSDSLQTILAVLGVGGVAGSLAAAWAFSFARMKRSLAAGYALCGLAAVAAVFTRGGVGFATAAGAVGFGMGWTTVTLAAGLRGLLGEARLGWWCGLGTGVAYAVCNVPVVFETSPVNQALIAAAVMLVGLSATLGLDVRAVEPRRKGDFSPLAVAGWLVVLLALVWLDSAAFFVIQHAPALKSSTWEGGWRLWGNATTHLGAALATGWVLDRGWLGRVAGIAGTLLVVACLMLTLRGAGGGASVAYTAGVSLYSTVLVFFPAQSGRASVAGLLYAAAGWGGSALGIGMAQNLAEIPLWFLAVASAVMVFALGLRWRVLPTAAVLVAAGGVISNARAADDPQVQLGREVYVSEGCIHCHSQFVRPRIAAEVERWGPAQPLAATLKASPPMLGNRRQGPDLAEVGNRRSAEWQRLHLRNPQALVSGSRMPDYAHLFEGDAPRGDALVAYLGSLGGETLAPRVAATATWRPTVVAGAVPEERAARLFAELCASCHGSNGRGDGVLVDELSVRPPDFSRDAWRRAGDGNREAVARVIKFGVPGTPMAGHEYLSDADVVALAGHVIALHSQERNTP